MTGLPLGCSWGREQPAHDVAAEVGAEQGVGLVHAAGAGHVDLDQPAVDHVEPGQRDAVGHQPRRRAPRRSGGRRRRSARRRPGRRSGSRRRRDGASTAPTISPSTRNSRLLPSATAGRYSCAITCRPAGGRRLGQRPAAAARLEQPHVGAGEPVDRLDDRGAVAATKSSTWRRTAVTSGGRAQVGELQGEQLLVQRPDAGRVVDDPHARRRPRGRAGRSCAGSARRPAGRSAASTTLDVGRRRARALPARRTRAAPPRHRWSCAPAPRPQPDRAGPGRPAGPGDRQVRGLADPDLLALVWRRPSGRPRRRRRPAARRAGR